MRSDIRKTALGVMSTGLIGLCAYQIILRVNHPAALDSDLVHGIWVGVCLGLELIGVALLKKSKFSS
ncbi:hypothetical protein GCM10011396_10980 [Undibacterium terreum]|uniref:Uncharacterized protein n=1 Tax=Undibacterium terreum TaxID=1224302 RepID=A0A916UAU1_9BURK|nr:hypothetical protein GCM10011396_10980 [Undibacterium terreum]